MIGAVLGVIVDAIVESVQSLVIDSPSSIPRHRRRAPDKGDDSIFRDRFAIRLRSAKDRRE